MTLQASENLRYLLWKANVSREQWESKLANTLHCDRQHALELLHGGETLTSEELNLAAGIWDYEDDDLLFTPLVQIEEINVLHENIRYFLDSLEHGKKGELADKIGVHATTISKWRSAEQVPSSRHLDALKWNFGIPPGKDLKKDPLFLSLSPIGDSERRQWLLKQIEGLERNTLIELFPALERLLK